MEFKRLLLEDIQEEYESSNFLGCSSFSNLISQNLKPVAISYFDQITENPWELIDLWEHSRSFKLFIKENPKYRYKTVVDVLCKVKEEELSPYPDVKEMKVVIESIILIMSNNFKKTISSFQSQDLTLSESHVKSLKDFIKLEKPHKKIKIKEVNYVGEITPDQAERAAKSFQAISTLIPDKYKKNIPPITLIIQENDNKPAFVKDCEESPVVVVFMRKDRVLMMSEILHEYGHLIEKYNPDVMKITNEFLRDRILSEEKCSIEEFSTQYNRPFSSWNKDEIIYPNDLMDPYMGKTYGDLMKKDCPTEVLSTALQVLYIDPVKIFLQDPACFKLISGLLHGLI